MFYVQLNKDNIITDIVEYEANGYILVDISTPLPSGINGGWYMWNGVEAILIPELKEAEVNNQIQNAIDNYTEELIKGGLL